MKNYIEGFNDVQSIFIKVNICYVNNEKLSFNKYDVLSFIPFIYTYTLGFYIYINI